MLPHIREIEIPYLIRAANNIVQLVMQVIYPRFFHADNIKIFIIETTKGSVAFFLIKGSALRRPMRTFTKFLSDLINGVL